jgi:hypothetical protein
MLTYSKLLLGARRIGLLFPLQRRKTSVIPMKNPSESAAPKASNAANLRLLERDNPPPILSKRQFVREYKRGTFGNAAPTWNTLEEFLAAEYRGRVHIRNRVASGPTWYNIDSLNVASVWNQIERGGLATDSLYLSGMAPHDHGTIQGEVVQS